MLYHKNAWLERLNTLMLQFKTDSQVIVGQAVTEYNQVGGGVISRNGSSFKQGFHLPD